MKLIGLLAWYDEPAAELVAAIKSLAEAGVTEIVAVDGAYALYPDGRAASDPNQAAAIVLSCKQLGLGCTLHVPREPWAGNEVEKRTFLFRLGLSVAEPGDWFWVFDADEVVTEFPDDLKERLAGYEHDAAEVEIFDTIAARAKLGSWPERFAMRQLFRAQPIKVETNHITYVTGDGRLLWGYDGDHRPAEPCLDLTDCLVVEHRPDRRSQERLQAKLVYYTARDASCVERGECERCGAPAVRLVPKDWRWTGIGPAAMWMECCEACTSVQEAENRAVLEGMGVDPDSVVHTNRNGHIPKRLVPDIR